jgi:tryptophan 7-halogenase
MSPLDAVVESLEPQDAAAVRAWLGHRLNPTSLLANHEPLADDHLLRPQGDDPAAVRTVGVIGGGTAGYLTALALRARRPWLDVTLVESTKIPIIGVGEATVPEMLRFLHQYLGIEPAEFYASVMPTWKLGIKFEWGPDPAGFMAPFDWGSHSIGALGALGVNGSINGFSLGSLLMMADRTAVFDVAGRPVSLMPYLPFAYHLDNARFVRYLTELAGRRGVRHVDATIAKIVLRGDDWVDHLRTADGRDLRYDFYVDCTGFRSRLLGDALHVPFQSYAGSLFTDSAVTGNHPHGGHLKPYTTATTMGAGWCWTIPVPESDHLGYVYSSAAIPDDEAGTELSGRFPGIADLKQVRFRSGRHKEAWRGNVMAVGNSYAFVEPLESSGLLMITGTLQLLVSSLPATWSRPTARAVVNRFVGAKWDALRWFLAIHYRFNTRLDTPFWKEARSLTDVSGIQPLLDIYASGAPLARQDRFLQHAMKDAAPPVFELAGVDNILLGQHVPAQLLPANETPDQWRMRWLAASALVRRAMPQREALAAFRSDPRLLRALFDDPSSWVGRDRKYGVPETARGALGA